MAEDLLGGLEGGTDEVLMAELLETGTGGGGVEVDALKERFNFDRGLGGGGESTLGTPTSGAERAGQHEGWQGYLRMKVSNRDTDINGAGELTLLCMTHEFDSVAVSTNYKEVRYERNSRFASPRRKMQCNVRRMDA